MKEINFHLKGGGRHVVAWAIAAWRFARRHACDIWPCSIHKQHRLYISFHSALHSSKPSNPILIIIHSRPCRGVCMYCEVGDGPSSYHPFPSIIAYISYSNYHIVGIFHANLLSVGKSDNTIFNNLQPHQS